MESIIRAVCSSGDDFKPYCLWERDEALETLVIHLPEFKKDQLKVHISVTGILKISGERVVSETKRSHFQKELRVQSNWNADEIRAKFSAGHLRIMIPKKALPANGRDSRSQQCQNNGKPRLEVTGQDEVTTKTSNYDQLGGAKVAVLWRRKVTMVKVMATLVILVVAFAGVYSTFKYWIYDKK